MTIEIGRPKPRPVVLTEYDKRVFEAFLAATQDGNWAAKAALKQEALTTSDFPAAFQTVNQAILQGALAQYEPTWPIVAKRLTVQNLKPHKEMTLDVDNSNLPASSGGEARLPASLPNVPELTPYPTVNFTASGAEYSTAKKGARVHFSWEAWLNDDWDQIANFPNQLRDLAVNTEETQAWSQFYAANGFNVGMFPAGNNLLGNPALTLESLQNAISQAMLPPATPATGIRPLRNPLTSFALLVPTSMVFLAESILNATNVQVTDADGTIYNTTTNIRQRVTIVEVPWIPFLATSSAYIGTSWALVPLRGEGVSGTTAANVFLAGEQTPELRIKIDQGASLGGGALGPYSGSFDVDDTQIRIRYFVAGRTLDNTNTVWSKGTGAAGTTP